MTRDHDGIDPKPLPMLRDGSPPKKTKVRNDSNDDTRGGIDKLLRDLLGTGDR